MLHIITDSSCDLPKELLRQYHIHVVPLTVVIDGKEYTEGLILRRRNSAKRCLARVRCRGLRSLRL
jgi:fatty acid-binding protein DegV